MCSDEQMEHYRKEMLDMAGKLKNPRYVTMAYGFVRRLYREERAGKEVYQNGCQRAGGTL